MFILPIIMAQIGVGWLFIRYLIQRDRGAKEPGKALFLAGALGFLAVVIAFFLESRLLPGDFAVDNLSGLPVTTLAQASVWIGLIEEGAKLIPLALLIYGRKFFDEVTDGIVYFGTAGMMFGIVENVMYSVTYGSEVGLSRLLTIPFLHAGFCVCFGWLLARRKVLRTSWVPVLGGLAAAIGLHALYDFCLFYGQWWSILIAFALTIGLNLIIFRLYSVSERTDRKLGLSTGADNWYCPHCGRPNPQRHLHCPACGRKP